LRTACSANFNLLVCWIVKFIKLLNMEYSLSSFLYVASVLLPASCPFLARFILWPWRRRWHFP
jgi:hypothetical protein